ncbi:MAG: hypothetical protein H6R41_1213, partial [Deltaproteobacteria bacterium]|nr:hypothetical protein [Deltaproteobacteria bacterium]
MKRCDMKEKGRNILNIGLPKG